MKIRQIAVSLIAFAMTAALVACSSGSSSGGGGGGNPITVSLSGAPSSLATNATAQVTATVANDTANAGVTWSCTPSGSCGSFNPTSTASGTATTYTAPAAAGSVTITATSVTNTAKSASATVSVTAPAIALGDGSYVFSVSGANTAGNAYAVIGAFTVSGGAITGGEQDYVDSIPTTDTHDAINATGSSFAATADGNLQITLTTCLGQTCTSVDPVIGGGSGIETFNGTLVSTSTCATTGGPCRAKLIEFDATSTSSGTLELQDSTAATTAPAGAYVFGTSGPDLFPVAAAGIFSVSGTTISTAATVFDINLAGTASSAQTITAGSVTAPDTTGRFQIAMTSTVISPAFAAYIVDANHMQLIEAQGPLVGTAYLQNTGNLAVSGNTYVVGMNGLDSIAPLQAAGALTLAQGASGVTGTISYNDDNNGIQPAGAITGGTYVADTTFPGRVTITGLTDGTTNNPNTFALQLYVDGNGNAFAISMDATDVMGGAGYQQTGGGSFTAASFSGPYALNVTGYDVTNVAEYDAVGPVSADGVGTLSQPASTGVDQNWLGSATLSPGLTVSGAFTAASSGVFPGTLTGLDVSGGTSDTYTYYLVDSPNTKVIAIEVDGVQWGLGTWEFQQ